jgi:hypothetical protein|uniref:DUF763 domain-containing protein n=1 Tax=candidate division WOR-3 bacterium TaxID=2052148 RepID=A0A7V3PUK2_UNCW3
MRRGIAELPLHYGTAPGWLFERMKRLICGVVQVIVAEYGVNELLRRLSDPVWFQSLGCVAGFDWHSSGVTTTVSGALKEGIKGMEKDLGFFVCGGKGRASRRTPQEIENFAQKFGLDGNRLIQTSRLVAKVDGSALQDGFQIYHHIFIGTLHGEWAIVQQGMNPETRWARRYHWFSDELKSFVVEPHKGIAGPRVSTVLNMTAKEAESARQMVTAIASKTPDKTVEMFSKIKLPVHHPIFKNDISPNYLKKILLKTYEQPPVDFPQLLLTPGVGPKTIRALALLAEVIYGAPLSFRDPVTYTFAHGGKDGYPYPVNRAEYDRSISFLEKGIKEAKLGRVEKLNALRRLEQWSRIQTGQR